MVAKKCLENEVVVVLVNVIMVLLQFAVDLTPMVRSFLRRKITPSYHERMIWGWETDPAFG